MREVVLVILDLVALVVVAGFWFIRLALVWGLLWVIYTGLF